MSRRRDAAPVRAQPAAEAALLTLLQPCREHVEARCRHFGQCGGCQLQDVEPAEQVHAKRTMLAGLLHGAGLNTVPDIATHAAEPWFYRNRVRFRVQDGSLGYSRRASNEFLPVTECPILSPALWQTARALQATVQGGTAHWPEGMEAVELFANEDGSALQLSVLLDATVQTINRDAPNAFRHLYDAVRRSVPQLAGSGLLVHAPLDLSQPRRVRESARVEIASTGAKELHYRVNGSAYRVTRGAFFQVNHFLTGTMQQLVVQGRGGRLAWDLYAGAGLFSVPLASQFDTVVAVEIGQPAATDLQEALHRCGPQHRAVCSTVHDFLRGQRRATPPDLIVLDPPRAGIGRELAATLAAADAAELVYVSCDADTFARDARTLVDSGYTLATLHLLDLFPQTFHTETVAVFRK